MGASGGLAARSRFAVALRVRACVRACLWPGVMQRIESCPSIVDSVSFFDYDTSIADSFHADLTPLPGSPPLHPGMSSCVPSFMSSVSSEMAGSPHTTRRTVPEHNELRTEPDGPDAASPAVSPRKDTGKALSAEERKQRRCDNFARFCATFLDAGLQYARCLVVAQA